MFEEEVAGLVRRRPKPPGARSRWPVVLCCVAVLAATAALVLIHVAPGWHAQDPCAVMLTRMTRHATPLKPRVVHKIWNTDVVEDAWLRTWNATSERLQGVTVRLWNASTRNEYMHTNHAWFMPTYTALKHEISRIDAFRTFILYDFGGVYMDMDYEVLGDFWDYLPSEGPAVVASYWLAEHFQNSFMSSPKGHPLWPVAWRLMRERLEQYPESPIMVTGPPLIDAAHRETGWVATLPCEVFYRVPYNGYGLPWQDRWNRLLGYQLGLYKPCGDTNAGDACQLTIHHTMGSWVKHEIAA
jgi:hypothetical protein